MIGLIKTPFWESNTPLDDEYLSDLTLYFLKDEKIFKTFKSFNFFAHFTNKRIIFTYCPGATFNPSDFEIEFLPYRSIQRFSFLADDKHSKYNLELTICDIPVLAFAFRDKASPADLAKIISEFSL